MTQELEMPCNHVTVLVIMIMMMTMMMMIMMMSLMQVLEMSGNQVTVLTSDVFATRSLIHLQAVSLAECGITKLHRYALRNLTNLVKLNLARNRLKTIPGYAFTSSPEIRSDTLSD